VTPPPLAHYNALAAARGLVTGDGRALRFVPPDALDIGYELRAYTRGEVVTRADNWHDAYNAEVWLEFPRAKSALNRRHVESMPAGSAAGRGRVRDRLTQFDECGVVVTGMSDPLWRALCDHRWREVFVEQRAELIATTRFLIFGHAGRDALRAPFIGLCGKMMRLDDTEVAADDTAAIDTALVRRLASADFSERFPALPLLAIPGITAANENPAYYDDTRQFRPARTG
jgi:hypothetical protein